MVKVKGGLGVTFAFVLAALVATPAPAASTRAEYISQADPICQTANAGEKKAFGGVVKDLKTGRWGRAAGKYARAKSFFAAGVQQLAVLQPPAADAAVINQWLAGLQAQLPLVDKLIAALRRGPRHPRPVQKAFAKLYRVSRQTQGLVATYGFQSCQKL